MQVWISGGGTGGHVYPGLTVVAASRADEDCDDVAFTWIGTARGLEGPLVTAAGLPFGSVTAAPLVGVPAWRLPWNVARLAWGSVQALAAMRRARPDVVLVTGGYASVPVAVAARAAGRPLAVYLPDIVPGRAVALVVRMARLVLTTRPEALPYLAGRATRVTGYPVRPAVRAADRAAARALLAVGDDEPVLVVFGGSQGARSINRAFSAAAPELLGSVVAVHATGRLDIDEIMAARDALPRHLAERWRVTPYLDDADMANALAAADLAVSRAGAAVLGEYPARGLPSVLVPLPIASGHQAANAAVLADVGAAVVVADDELTGARLTEVVRGLLGDHDRLAGMRAAAASLDEPDAAMNIWNALKELAAGGSA